MKFDNDLYDKIHKCADKGLELAKKGDYKRAIPLLTFAAENGHENSMANLGHLYELIKDYEKAFYWNKKAADLNNLTGIYNLLIAYQFGKGVEKNGEEAIKLTDKLIKLGNIDDGYFKKALIIKKGCGNLAPNPYLAFKIAMEGAEKVMKNKPNPNPGDPSECVLEVGIMYEFGQGVDANRVEAMKYYEYSSKCSNIVGMYNYAQCLNYVDESSLENRQKAFALYEKLCMEYYSDAAFELARFYLEGKGDVKKDNNKAMSFLGSALRMNNFGSHYNDAIKELKKLYPEEVDNIVSGQYSRIVDSNE